MDQPTGLPRSIRRCLSGGTLDDSLDIRLSSSVSTVMSTVGSAGYATAGFQPASAQ